MVRSACLLLPVSSRTLARVEYARTTQFARYGAAIFVLVSDSARFQWMLIQVLFSVGRARFRLRRLTSVEAAVHQQSGASAQLKDFSTRLDIFEDRSGWRIADALAERDANVPRHTCQGRTKDPREVSESC